MKTRKMKKQVEGRRRKRLLATEQQQLQPLFWGCTAALDSSSLMVLMKMKTKMIMMMKMKLKMKMKMKMRRGRRKKL